MSSLPIEWHEEILMHRRMGVQRLSAEWHVSRFMLDKMNSEIMKYERQIERAKRLKKKSFDSDKFKDQ